MFSIHKVSLCSLALLSLCATGCQLATEEDKGENMKLNPSIVIEDEAMRQRNWQRSSWKYENTSTLAQSTGRVWSSTDVGSANAITDTAVFAGNSVFGPFTFLVVPPWAPVYYRAVNIEPSYTAVPPVTGAPDPN